MHTASSATACSLTSYNPVIEGIVQSKLTPSTSTALGLAGSNWLAVCTTALSDSLVTVNVTSVGTGVSSYSYLKMFPFDYVKIDGSYADGVESDEKKSQELIDTVSALHAKGVLTAISGVDSPMVLSTLWEAGVNFIQGPYLSEPLEQMDYDFSSEDM